LTERDTRILLTAGIAAGFGAVFGTPLTGAIFALEVLTIGRMSYESLLACLIASVIGDYTTSAWGIRHTHYHIGALAHVADHGGRTVDWLVVAKVGLGGAAFGLTSVLFAELTHSLQRIFKRTIRWPALRPATGGVIVILLVWLTGSTDYLGLGVIADPHHPG